MTNKSPGGRNTGAERRQAGEIPEGNLVLPGTGLQEPAGRIKCGMA